MASNLLLWFDFRRDLNSPGSFPLLSSCSCATRIEWPQDPAATVLEYQPGFLGFEIDVPTGHSLTALQQTRLQHPSLPILVMSDKVSPAIAASIRRLGIWDHLISPVSVAELNACVEAFSNFCRQRHLGAPQETATCKPPRLPRTQAACEYVARHFASEVRLVTAASLCCLSESEFCRCFKKENGVTFLEYLMKLRLERACELLTEPAMQVKSVAFDVGFNDVSYFARAFRRHTGLTPSAYQRKARVGHDTAPAPAGTSGAINRLV